MPGSASAPSFRVLDAQDPADAQDWRDAWDAWPEREVFAHPGYVRLYASETARPLGVLFEAPAGTVLYPLLLRDLPAGLAGQERAHDLTGPYGYGGPYAWGTDPASLAPAFWEAFDRWCAGERVVSEFSRLTLDPAARLPFPGTTEERMQNVVRTLDAPAETLWMEFEHKVRKNVNRARRSGVTVEVDLIGERLDTFLEIYAATMDRRDAGEGYYFPRAYFEAIHRDLAGQFVYFFAVHEGRAVSAELALVSETSLYSFLGGTLRDAFDVRPNDLLKVEAIAWGQRRRKRAFVLGGGYAPDDGIYRYKKSFAPHGSVPFCVGTRVHDADRYARLVARRRAEVGEGWAPPDTFFPAYRA